MKQNMGLIPLKNFGVVSELHGIYRSAQPMYGYEYEWMKKMLEIRHIVNLRAESHHDDDFSKFGFGVLHLNVVDHRPPTIDQAKMFMKFVRECKNPILIHCCHGHGRTSTFSILAKLALGWTFKRAMEDELKRFHYNFKHECQLEFLKEHFDKK